MYTDTTRGRDNMKDQEYEDAYLVMPWGARHYRYKDLDDTNYPKIVKVEETGHWEICPNYNVALRIQRLINEA